MVSTTKRPFVDVNKIASIAFFSKMKQKYTLLKTIIKVYCYSQSEKVKNFDFVMSKNGLRLKTFIKYLFKETYYKC